MDLTALISSTFCHNLPERTYVVGGHALLLCARCTGVYLGLALGLAWALATPLRRAAAVPRRAVWICVVVIVLFALLGFGRLYGLVDLGRPARVALGLYFGAALGVMVWPVVANWIGGEEDLHAWDRLQWAAFLLLLGLPPAVTCLAASDVSFIHRVVGYASLLGLVVSWVIANMLVILWALRQHRKWSLASRLVALALALVCFALEVGLLRVWRSHWTA
jgi:uncharacterized membrane protein